MAPKIYLIFRYNVIFRYSAIMMFVCPFSGFDIRWWPDHIKCPTGVICFRLSSSLALLSSTPLCTRSASNTSRKHWCGRDVTSRINVRCISIPGAKSSNRSSPISISKIAPLPPLRTPLYQLLLITTTAAATSTTKPYINRVMIQT